VTNAIELQAIRKTFGPKVAVDSLDLVIPAGLMVGVIGPNGAGKTTTIRMIMSILFPDSGRLSVLGRASAVQSKDRIGYLPEERGLYKKMRVAAFLTYVARLKGVDASGLQSRVNGWLERVGLADNARKKCEELSKGMQQKVQFVGSIIHEPDLIILDEPFSGLDPVNSRLLTALIREQHAAGRTILFSTHQMSQAEALCDRIVMIHEGKKVLDNTPEEIRSRFDPRAVAFQPTGAYSQGPPPHPDIESLEAAPGHIRAHLRAGASAPAVVASIAASIPCNRIEIVRPTLDDVFVDIVTRGQSGDRQALLDSLRGSGDMGGD